jgi:Rieske Fe-S protein
MRSGDGGLLRRTVLGGLCCTAALCETPAPELAAAAADPRNREAQPGDLLVAFKNGGAGAVIGAADVPGDAAPLLAWPADPQTKIARDGSRLNLILVMRFDPSGLSTAERARAADGIVAYTAVCTHQACWVTDWLASKQLLQCPCHQSRYDPRQGGVVVTGPAPRALPALPLRIAAGRLAAKDDFTDRVGGAPAPG